MFDTNAYGDSSLHKYANYTASLWRYTMETCTIRIQRPPQHKFYLTRLPHQSFNNPLCISNFLPYQNFVFRLLLHQRHLPPD